MEHLDPSSYQKEGGDTVLLDLLDKRFPEKDKTDELGEMLTEVVGLIALRNGTVKGWVGRASELFDSLKRKPEEARGWLLLHQCGLSEEQKAVVVARAHGLPLTLSCPFSLVAGMESSKHPSCRDQLLSWSPGQLQLSWQAARPCCGRLSRLARSKMFSPD